MPRAPGRQRRACGAVLRPTGRVSSRSASCRSFLSAAGRRARRAQAWPPCSAGAALTRRAARPRLRVMRRVTTASALIVSSCVRSSSSKGALDGRDEGLHRSLYAALHHRIPYLRVCHVCPHRSMSSSSSWKKPAPRASSSSSSPPPPMPSSSPPPRLLMALAVKKRMRFSLRL